MVNTFEGNIYAQGDERFCIVISRFNDFIGAKLLEGAVDELKRHGVSENNIDVVRHPMQIVKIKLDKEVFKYDLIRLKHWQKIKHVVLSYK